MRAPEVSMLAEAAPVGFGRRPRPRGDTADRLGLDTIVAFTESGTTARLLGQYRPGADIYAFTPNESAYRRMAVYGEMTPLRFERISAGFVDQQDHGYAERHLLEPERSSRSATAW